MTTQCSHQISLIECFLIEWKIFFQDYLRSFKLELKVVDKIVL
jgi:hypothetical protein